MRHVQRSRVSTTCQSCGFVEPARMSWSRETGKALGRSGGKELMIARFMLAGNSPYKRLTCGSKALVPSKICLAR